MNIENNFEKQFVWCYCTSCRHFDITAPDSLCPKCGTDGVMQNIEPFLLSGGKIEDVHNHLIRQHPYNPPDSVQDFLDKTADK